MCWMAAIPVAMAGASSLMNSASEAQQRAGQIDMMRQQQWSTIKDMNMNEANLNLEGRDLLDKTVQDLTQSNLNRVRNMGTVRAAIGEGNLEGRSMDRVERITEGDFLRQQTGITDNYKRDYSVIFGKRLSNYEGSMAQINQLKKSEPKKKSGMSIALDAALGMGAAAGTAWASGGFDSKSAPKGGK